MIPCLNLRCKDNLLVRCRELIYIEYSHVSEFARKEHLHLALIIQLDKFSLAGLQSQYITSNYRCLACIAACKYTYFIFVLIIEYDK